MSIKRHVLYVYMNEKSSTGSQRLVHLNMTALHLTLLRIKAMRSHVVEVHITLHDVKQCKNIVGRVSKSEFYCFLNEGKIATQKMDICITSNTKNWHSWRMKVRNYLPASRCTSQFIYFFPLDLLSTDCYFLLFYGQFIVLKKRTMSFRWLDLSAWICWELLKGNMTDGVFLDIRDFHLKASCNHCRLAKIYTNRNLRNFIRQCNSLLFIHNLLFCTHLRQYFVYRIY